MQPSPGADAAPDARPGGAAYFRGRKVLLYLPAYNQATMIEKVLDRIPEEARNDAAEILVVDNCSPDGTADRARDYAARHGCRNLQVVRNERNLGYGGSQQLAYRRAIDRGYDAVVMIHGDGQYAPEIVLDILGPILDGRADFVFGSRILGDPLAGNMPWIRYVGNRALTFMQNLLLGLHVSEFHSGYRAFSVPSLRQVNFAGISTDYHFDTEMIILYAMKGLRIAEVPIPTHYGEERSFLNIWHYGLNVLYATARFWAHRIGLKPSARWRAILAAQESSPTVPA